MPNHVTSICTVTGAPAELARFAEKHLPTFSFEAIAPTPEVIKGTESGTDADMGLFAMYGLGKGRWHERNKGLRPVTAEEFIPRLGMIRGVVSTREQLLEHLKKTRPEALVKGEHSYRAYIETGHPDWYEWNSANWGTKWDAYDVSVREQTAEKVVFKFETAWSFPEPVFAKLALSFPELTFAILAYDEGSNFACTGEFGGKNDYKVVDATDELYERVYGHKPERDEEE